MYIGIQGFTGVCMGEQRNTGGLPEYTWVNRGIQGFTGVYTGVQRNTGVYRSIQGCT